MDCKKYYLLKPIDLSTVMVTKISNKMSNHLSPQSIEQSKKPTTYDVGNPGKVKLVYGIPTLPKML